MFRFAECAVIDTQLTSQAGEELYPSLSPDGRSLAYVSAVSGNWDIYSKRVGGQNVINLTEGSAAAERHPSFSPDGEFIAFESNQDGGGIFIMEATGENVRRLSDFGFHPAWSPDGTRIVFATALETVTPRDRGADSELWVVEVDTQDVRQIFEGDAIQPHWSPGGSRIAYWSQIGGQRDIWTIPADGGEPVAVTSDAPLDWNPVWSPEGHYLYFSSDRGGTMNLWRVPIDEESGESVGELEPVTTGVGSDSMYLSLSADGRRLSYAIRDVSINIMKVGFDPATSTAVGEPVPVTGGSLRNLTPDVSPDGNSVVFYRTGVIDSLESSQEINGRHARFLHLSQLRFQ